MFTLSGRGARHGSGFSAAVTISHRLWKDLSFPDHFIMPAVGLLGKRTPKDAWHL